MALSSAVSTGSPLWVRRPVRFPAPVSVATFFPEPMLACSGPLPGGPRLDGSRCLVAAFEGSRAAAGAAGKSGSG